MFQCVKPGCGSSVQDHLRECQACQTFQGYPNVRAAEAERPALLQRYKQARAAGAGYSAVLDDFEAAMTQSVAVISRPLSYVRDLLLSDTAVYISYHKQIQSGARLPQDNQYDQTRMQHDAWLFPYYHEEILFGALSLDGQGAPGYGGYAMVLHTHQIDNRATVFEENPFSFVTKHRVMIGQAQRSHGPQGYRATWSDRGILAVSKLYAELGPKTEKSQFPGIIVADRGGEHGADFIEVHIYGSINKFSVAKLIARKPSDRGDRALFDDLVKKLSKTKIAVEII